MTVITKITLVIKGKERTFYPKKMLALEGKNLQQELFQHSNMLFFWNRQLTRAKAAYRKALSNLLVLKAEKHVEFFRFLIEEEGVMFPKTCDAYTEQDNEVIHKQKIVRKLQEDVDTLESIVDAIRDRGHTMRALLYKERNYE